MNAAIQKIALILPLAAAVYAALRLLGGTVYGILLAVLGCLCILFQFLSKRRAGHSPFYRICVWISGVYQALLLYFLVALIATDLIRLFSGIRCTWAAALASVAVTAYGVANARHLVVRNYTVPRPAGTDRRGPQRIVLLSDLHIGSVVGRHQIRRVVRCANAQDADLIVITGDIFNHMDVQECAKPERVAQELAGLRSRHGTYSVLGNHDPRITNRALRDFLEKARIEPIDNRSVEVDGLTLVGRTGVVGRANRMLLRSLIPEKHGMTVVLDHDPQGIPEARACGADLILCGHTHQGQFWPCTLFTKLSYAKGMFYGYSCEGRTRSIVSAGTGYFQMPIRIGTHSEVVVIDIQDPPAETDGES